MTIYFVRSTVTLCLTSVIRYVIFPDKEYPASPSIVKLKSRLSEIIEPDFGLLDQLLGLKVLTRRQYEDVLSEKGAAYRRNEPVLDLMKSEDQCSKFLKALHGTVQQHVVNFIAQNGGQRDSAFV